MTQKSYIVGLGTGGRKIAKELLVPMVEGTRIDAEKGGDFYLPDLIKESLEDREIMDEVGKYIRKGKESELKREGFGSDFFKLGYVLSKAGRLREGLSKKIFEKIERALTTDCDRVLFTVCFGGGTGTALINSISRQTKSLTPKPPVFVLGTLTERCRQDEQNVTFEDRCLTAACSIYELLNEREVSALILMDNDILMEKCGIRSREELENYRPNKKDYKKINEYISDRIRLMIDPRNALSGVNMERSFTFNSPAIPPIFVPCYSDSLNGKVEDLLENAINNGKLMECDLGKADKVCVFTSGISRTKENEIKKWFMDRVQGDKGDIDVDVLRVTGGFLKNEVLLLLRNPYGRENDKFFDRLSEIIENAKRGANGKKEELRGEDLFQNEKDVIDDIDKIIKELEKVKQRCLNGEKQLFVSEERHR